MTTILNRERYCGLPAEHRRDLAAAEQSAHRSALAICEFLETYLSDELKARAPEAVAVGMISALARMLAERRPAAAGRTLIDAVQAILPQEFEYWAKQAGGEHVRH